MDSDPAGGQTPLSKRTALSRLDELLEQSSPAEAGKLLDQMGLSELKRLLTLVARQYEPLFARRKKICLVGPVNTGKSSLYNALVGPSAPKAEVSPVPGTTRQSLMGDATGFWVIDTPGANEAVVGPEAPAARSERRAAALEAALSSDLLVIVFDASQGIAQDEMQIYTELTALGKPFLIVLNKVDLVRSSRDAVRQAAAQSLQLSPEEIIMTSATRRINLNGLLLAILKTDRQLLATLAETVPGSRWLLANNTVVGASVAAGMANIITAPVPVPFASFVPITSIQVAMVLNLARVFGYRLTLARAKEVAATFGSALLGRTLFYHLVDLVPVAGWVLGTAVAAGTTMALGYSVALWFAHGERLSNEAVGRLGEVLTQALVERLKRFPDRKTLKKGIRRSVQDTLGQVEAFTASMRSYPETTERPLRRNDPQADAAE